MTESEWLASLLAKEMVRHNGETDCWEWLGATNRWGYGRLTAKKKWWASHRYAFATFRGPIPDGLWVLHECDNPSCVNPAHLFLGTHDDNMQDMVKKGRWNGAVLLGQDNGRAVLTEAIVRKARALAQRIGCRAASCDIAGEFGVSFHTVRRAIRRQTWRHL